MGSRNRNASQNSLDEVSVPHPMSKKWVPYKYLSGMMVYLHQNVVDNEENIGGEFMVSTIVQGSAEQCLSALTQRSSGMSVLGPAAAVDTISGEGDSQVLHIRLSAPSAAATSFSSSSMLAARHAVIQQTRSTDPHGIHTIMFRSLPPQQARQVLQQQQQQQFCMHCQQQHQQWWWWTQAVLHCCRRIDSMIATVAAGVASYSSSSSRGSSRTAAAAAVGDLLWSRVLAEVAGGYSIANLSSATDHPGGESQESLLTCVIKVNLGGYLLSTTTTTSSSSSSSSWMSSWSPTTRLADAFIDQMLSAVAMVKNAVEQQQQQQGHDAEQDHFLRVSHNLAPDTVADNITTSSSSSSRVQLAASHHHHSSSSCCNASNRQHHPSMQGRQQQQQPDLCCCYNTYSNSYCQCESGPMYRIAQKLLQSMTGTAAAARSVHCNVQYNGAGECNDSSSWSGHCSSDYDHHNKQHQHYHRLSQRQQQQQSSSNKPEPDHQDICSESSADSFRSPRASSTDYGSRSSSSSSSSSDAVTVDHHRHDGILPQQAAATADDLVALDGSGQPLRGTCNPCFWCPLHQPEAPAAPFKVRGSSYLCDHTKVSAGTAAYQLISVDLVDTPAAVDHIARYLPTVRRNRAAFCFVINMLVPTAQSVMNLVMTFGSTTHWREQQQQQQVENSHSSSGSNMRGFERVLHRFMQGSDAERSSIFKMIPHIEVGPWLLKQAVGSTPVIMGRKLVTRYHQTDRYIEVDIDVTTCKTAGYIVQSIKGMTSSLVVDLCYLLEGQRPEELPEVLIGAVRFTNIDMTATTPLDMSQEVPCWPQPWR